MTNKDIPAAKATSPSQVKADEIKAETEAANLAEAKKATAEAREQSKETNAEQEAATPYPSQEEADRMKSAAATSGVPYKTRAAAAE